MKTKNIILLIILVAVLGGIGWIMTRDRRSHVSQVQGEKQFWYCPMHPWIKYDKPGVCPICGMALVPGHVHRQQTENPITAAGIPGYIPVEISYQRQQLIGLRTQTVAKKPVVKLIRTFGTISSDLDLYKIQNEFIDAFVMYVNVHRDYKRINDRGNPWGIHRDIQTSLLEAQDKLLKLGLSKEEIAKLQNVSWNQMSRQPKLLMFNDSRSYWVMAQIFEQDYRFVHEGQIVEISIPALNEKIIGTIRSVGGFIDPTSRSVTALIELNDNSGQLAANMQVDITIPVKLGDAILVPREAVMDIGLRKIVFVCKPGDNFEPREIQTGWETDEGYEINSGLKEGDRIVVSGNFLLDSESRIQGGLQASTTNATEGETHG